MNRFAVPIAAAIAGTLLGAAMGFCIGVMLGGNYFTNFELGDVRGYEAVGRLGLFVGAALGGASGFVVARLVLMRGRLLS